MKSYASVNHFERETSLCPLHLAQRVLDEARDYFRAELPEAYAARLARRAEAVLARHPFWQRKYAGPQGRAYLLMSMRHWLAGVLAREQPALFRQLPDAFKVGRPLPPPPLLRASPPRAKPPAPRPYRNRVHGAETLLF